MKKSVYYKTDNTPLGVYGAVLVITICFTLVNQGGYFEGAIALSGFVMALFTLKKSFEIKVGLSDGMFLLFSLWYLFCSVKNGFVTEYALRGLLPLNVFVFTLYTANLKESKEKIKAYILKFSLILAIFSIGQCLIGTNTRLLFPFNYSNVAGIYFSLCFFMCEKHKDKILEKARWIFFIALLLSQSVGAIILFVILQFFIYCSKKEFKKLSLMIIGIIVIIVVFQGRIYESGGTFIERLLHIHDGIRCMIQNPFFGIGAGWWECAKETYKTGFYSASAIHSSIVQIGVNSGFPGLLIFLASVILKLKSSVKRKRQFLLVMMVLIHSMMDFTLSFIAVNFLTILLLDEDCERKVEIRQIVKYVFNAFVLIAFVLSTFAIFSASVAKDFETNYFANHSVRRSREYAQFLVKNGQYLPDDVFFDFGYLPTEIVIYKSYLMDEGGEYLITELKAERYNSALRKFIEENYPEYGKEVGEIYSDAVDSLSCVGKILYELKGENL